MQKVSILKYNKIKELEKMNPLPVEDSDQAPETSKLDSFSSVDNATEESILNHKLNHKSELMMTELTNASKKLRTPKFSLLAKSCKYSIEEKDVEQHCCLSKVRCYGYVISDCCSRGTEYEVKKGKHYPLKESSDGQLDQELDH
jgi:hypothetical protein